MAEASLPPAQVVSLKLALVPKNAALLEKKLLSIATPGSTDFRKYISKQEITSIVGRSDEEISQLRKWLNDRGVADISVHPHK